MRCSHGNCPNEAVGEAYYTGIDKWHPYCEVHLETRRKGGMKTRKYTGER